ncbi:MAG: PP2C family protein-serine/threonine phosphatase [bacterium]
MKKSKFPACLQRYREAIEVLSKESFLCAAALYNMEGKLEWYNWVVAEASAFSEKQLKSMNASDLFLPALGVSNEEHRKKLFFEEPERFYFRLKTNLSPNRSYNARLRYEVKYEPFGINGIGTILHIGADKRLVLSRMVYYGLDKIPRDDPSSFYIYADAGGNILSFSKVFLNLLQPVKGPIVGQPLMKYFVKEDWQRMEAVNKRSLREFKRIYINSTHKWIKRYSCRFDNKKVLNDFWFDARNSWKIDRHGLMCRHKTDMGFFTCKKPVKHYNMDIRIKLIFFGKIDHGICMYINARPGNIDPNMSTPDGSGYILGFEIINKKPHVRLRKRAHTIAYGTNVVPDKAGMHEMICEKSGARLCLYLDGALLLEHYDLNPIFSRDLDYCGIMNNQYDRELSEKIRILEFSVFSRSSLLGHKHVPKIEPELRLKNRKNRIFRVRSHPYRSGPVGGYFVYDFSFDDITEIKNYQRKLERSEKEKSCYIKKIDSELESARNIQQSLIPQGLPSIEGLKFACRFIPTGKVGGDMYNIIQLDKKRIAILLFDVCGHGLPAAFIASMAAMAFNNNIYKYRSVSEIVNAANRDLTQSIKTEHFVAAFLGILNIKTLKFVYSISGHIPPMHFNQFSKTVNSLIVGGVPLGIFPEVSYEEHCLELRQGDRLFFYTDGLNESFNSNQEQFGHKRLINLLIEHAGGNEDDILKYMERERFLFTGKKPNEDDITMLIMGIENAQ